jgi:hypothetical protein
VKSIELSFRSDSFDFELIKRRGRIALFSKTKSTHRDPCYEVVILQIHEAERILGYQLPKREAMPPSESWGNSGWSYSNLEAAMKRFDSLVKDAPALGSPTSND